MKITLPLHKYNSIKHTMVYTNERIINTNESKHVNTFDLN